MKRILSALAFVTFIFALAGCGGGNSPTTTTTPPAVSSTPSTAMPGTEVKVTGGSYWVISPAQLAGMKRSDFFLVNVDAQPSLVIAGTDLFVKYTEVTQNLSKFPAGKTARIVVYCISGNTSRDAAAQLAAAGYNRVMELDGGITKWIQQGYPAVAYSP